MCVLFAWYVCNKYVVVVYGICVLCVCVWFVCGMCDVYVLWGLVCV